MLHVWNFGNIVLTQMGVRKIDSEKCRSEYIRKLIISFFVLGIAFLVILWLLREGDQYLIPSVNLILQLGIGIGSLILVRRVLHHE